jgi:hypothetical protein
MNFLQKTSFLASVFLATQLVCSQEAIPVSAVEATASGDSVNDTVGQVFYTTHSDTTVAISQGVQHPFEFQTLSNPALITVNLTAVPHPNPTKDFIILKVSKKNKTLKTLKTFKINKHQ